MVFLTENIGTILVGLFVAGVCALIVRKLVRDRKRGKTCGSCDGCAGGCGERRTRL
ncbi:MAG: FeoB-associated Cys-rich membrane protein [Oscillospiraceae bacterium]|jgi:hypothetical protein|nr:FeoB-associated Cys-rich membrane protein [Oscillospiraceae bacterium]